MDRKNYQRDNGNTIPSWYNVVAPQNDIRN